MNYHFFCDAQPGRQGYTSTHGGIGGGMWRYIPWNYPFLGTHPYIPYHLLGHISHSIPMSLLYPMFIYIYIYMWFMFFTSHCILIVYIIHHYIYIYMSYVLCICTQYIQLTSFNNHIPFIEYKHHIYIYIACCYPTTSHVSWDWQKNYVHQL